MKIHAAGPLSRRQALVRTAAWLGVGGAAASFVACRKPKEGPVVTAGMYGDTPAELHRLWTDILTACQTDDRGRVHDLLVSLILTPAELISLIGTAKASELGSRYKAMMASLCNAGGVELVAQVYEKKYDDVVVIPTAPPNLNATDQEVFKALVVPTPIYTVRVKRRPNRAACATTSSSTATAFGALATSSASTLGRRRPCPAPSRPAAKSPAKLLTTVDDPVTNA